MKIDNNKVLTLLQKCYSWAENQNNQLIAVCGFYLIQNIVININNNSMLNNTRKNKLSAICTKLL